MGCKTLTLSTKGSIATPAHLFIQQIELNKCPGSLHRKQNKALALKERSSRKVDTKRNIERHKGLGLMCCEEGKGVCGGVTFNMA